MARGIIEQLLEWQSRAGDSRSPFELQSSLRDLRRYWEDIKDEDEEGTSPATDIVPMRCVTILEVFTREIVREVIDRGSPYVDRADSLIKHTKLDFSFARNLQGEKFSLGEFVAHVISLNGIEAILSAFETLMPEYRANVSQVHDRADVEILGKPLTPIIADIDDVITKLKKLFEVRHILTHELPHEEPYDTNEVDGYIESARQFMDATAWYITGLLDGNFPLTQVAMTQQAGAALDVATAELKDTLDKVRAPGVLDGDLLAKGQEAWETYASADADLYASRTYGGSMQPMMWALAKEKLVRERIKNLRWWLEGNL